MTSDVLLLLLAAAAVFARALFVAAECALTGVSPERAEELHRLRGSFETRALLALKRDLEGTAATVRGGSVAGLALAAALSGAASSNLLERQLAEALPLGAVAAAVVGAAACALAIFLVDIVPRSLAISAPETWAQSVSLPIWAASRLVAPPARSLRALLDRLLRPLGAKATFQAPAPALEDIERYLAEEDDEDAPAPELVHSLFEFSTRIAREIMVPRTEVVGVPLDVEPEELVQLVTEQGHSRLPVYDGEIDRIVGVLHTRDIVSLLAHPELIKLPDVIRSATFVPWATKIDRLLRTMQRERIHMAMVTDEHGGFLGLVTLEDILEEIVGDIQDEYDAPEPGDVQPQPDGTHLVKAQIPIADFNEALGAQLPDDGDFDTLAGYLNSLAGHIPDAGARLASHGLVFTIEERTPRRILSVRVRRAERQLA